MLIIHIGNKYSLNKRNVYSNTGNHKKIMFELITIKSIIFFIAFTKAYLFTIH